MTSKAEKPLFKLPDLIILAAVAAICLLTFFITKKSGARIAVITVNGETVREIDLDTAPDETFTLDTEPTVTLRVEDGCIFFTDAKCPDRTCQKSGKLKNNGDTAACLPAKTAVTVKADGGNAADAVAF